MTRGVIFDLDGVLVTTDEYHYQAWKALADGEGIPFDRAVNERLRGVSRMASLEIILERATKPYTAAQKQAMAERKNALYVSFLPQLSGQSLLPGVPGALRALRAAGVRLAIGSSSKNTPLILRYTGLEGCFDAVADGNEIKNSKPDPEVFLLAAHKLGLAPQECLVVEDACAGVSAALAGGMRVLGVGPAAADARATLRAPSLAAIDLAALIAQGKI